MAGIHRHRNRRRARTRHDAEPSPPEPTALISREVTVVERSSKKICHTSGSSSSPSSGPQVWADLLDSLLHEIIALFGSFHDFVGFVATCRSWLDVVPSFASIYTFNFPPLHLKPDVNFSPREHNGLAQHIRLSDCKWKISNPAKRGLTLRCSVPRNTPNQMLYMGCSYGYLIFFQQGHSLLVNVYTGTEVKPPILPYDENRLDIYCGILMPPCNSASSCFLLFSKTSMFQWQFGTDSWSEQPFVLGSRPIHQIVCFKGEIFAMDTLIGLHTIRVAPQVIAQRVSCFLDTHRCLLLEPWLVVCGDMLLMVDISLSVDQLNLDQSSDMFHTFHVFRQDLSVKLTGKWVEMEKLENRALFVSLDRRNPTFCCKNPEIWGGKSNCIYVAHQAEGSDEPWTVVELGQPQLVPKTMSCSSYGRTYREANSQLDGLWVLPSFVYGAGL